jgi:S-adenosylmethionine hydrolase
VVRPPAAAALARGESIDTLGVPITSAIVRHTPQPTRRSDGVIVGEVLFLDRFGNAITNLIGTRGGTIEVGQRRVRLCRTYAEVPPGELVAVVGSTGFIEIAVRDGSAAEKLALSRGAEVVLCPG